MTLPSLPDFDLVSLGMTSIAASVLYLEKATALQIHVFGSVLFAIFEVA